MHFLSETPVYDCVALESHASDKQLNLIIFDLEVSVFYNFYKKNGFICENSRSV